MAKESRRIFNTYLHYLPGMVGTFNELCGTTYNTLQYDKNIKIYFITQKLSETDIDSLDKENFYDNISDDLGKKVRLINEFKLLNVNEKTFDKDTLEESEYSYQRMNDVDIKTLLFPGETENTDEYIKDCIAINSIDYADAKSAYNSDHTDDKKYKAFINDYSITSDKYNHNEYTRLDVKEDKITNNEIVIYCDDLKYFKRNDADTILSTGIYGFLISYKDTVTDKIYNSDREKYSKRTFEIPMMLYQFRKPTFSNYNKIKLVFNVNGLFGVV